MTTAHIWEWLVGCIAVWGGSAKGFTQLKEHGAKCEFLETTTNAVHIAVDSDGDYCS